MTNFPEGKPPLPEFTMRFRGPDPTDRMAFFGITGAIRLHREWRVEVDGRTMSVPHAVGDWLAEL